MLSMKRLTTALIIVASLLGGGFHALALPNLFISDGDNVDVYNGSSLTPGFISVSGAAGLAVGVDGTVYAGSSVDAQIYSYNPTTGVLTGTFVPFLGSNDPASVQAPAGMAWGPDGHLYVADINAGNVHVYNGAGGSITTLSGSAMGQPVSVAFNHAGQLFAADSNGVELFNGTEFVSYIEAISGGGSYVLNIPGAVGFSSAGDTYILDVSGASAGILKFTGNTFDGRIVDFSSLPFAPSDMIVGPDDRLYVSGVNFEEGDGEVLAYNLDGSGGSAYVTGLDNPTAMAFAVPEPSANLLLLCGASLTVLGMTRLRRRVS